MGSSFGSVLGGIGSLVGGVGSLVGGLRGGVDTPNIGGSFDQFRTGFTSPLTTPTLSLSGGTLTRNAGAFNPGFLNAPIQSLGGIANSLGALRSNISPLQGGLTRIQGGLQGLAGQVAPGFGRLTEARVRAIRDAGAESIGNLRESLGRRNVLGSSFADDAMTRARLAVGQEEERARAEATVQEIDMSAKLLADQAMNYGQQLGMTQADAAIFAQLIPVYQSQAQIMSSMLDRELNELAVSGNIVNAATAAVQGQAIAQAQLQMLGQAQNQGQQSAFFGSLGQNAGNIGSGLERVFSIFNRSGGNRAVSADQAAFSGGFG